MRHERKVEKEREPPEFPADQPFAAQELEREKGGVHGGFKDRHRDNPCRDFLPGEKEDAGNPHGRVCERHGERDGDEPSVLIVELLPRRPERERGLAPEHRRHAEHERGGQPKERIPEIPEGNIHGKKHSRHKREQTLH